MAYLKSHFGYLFRLGAFLLLIGVLEIAFPDSTTINGVKGAGTLHGGLVMCSIGILSIVLSFAGYWLWNLLKDKKDIPNILKIRESVPLIRKYFSYWITLGLIILAAVYLLTYVLFLSDKEGLYGALYFLSSMFLIFGTFAWALKFFIRYSADKKEKINDSVLKCASEMGYELQSKGVFVFPTNNLPSGYSRYADFLFTKNIHDHLVHIFQLSQIQRGKNDHMVKRTIVCFGINAEIPKFILVLAQPNQTTTLDIFFASPPTTTPIEFEVAGIGKFQLLTEQKLEIETLQFISPEFLARYGTLSPTFFLYTENEYVISMSHDLIEVENDFKKCDELATLLIQQIGQRAKTVGKSVSAMKDVLAQKNLNV